MHLSGPRGVGDSQRWCQSFAVEETAKSQSTPPVGGIPISACLGAVPICEFAIRLQALFSAQESSTESSIFQAQSEHKGKDITAPLSKNHQTPMKS